MSKFHEDAGRVLMVGLPGTDLDRPTADRLRALAPAGVILFARNLDSPEQTVALLERVRELLPHPPLFAIDQEGGRVSRLEPWVGPTPTAASLAAGDGEAVRRFGRATADALRVLGFNLDFAPVVDLCEPAATNGIADRSFGTDPEEVARLAGLFLDGLQGAGVAGCLKHFPGLGDTRVDSHEELPTVRRGRRELEAVDLLPFRRLLTGAASVMVGHGHYPAFDPEERLPASLSPTLVGRLLRTRFEYRGLIVSDDLEMGAVRELDREGAAAVLSIGAGCDLLLYCGELSRAEQAAAALARAAGEDEGFQRRLRRAARATAGAAARWSAPPAEPNGWRAAAEVLAAFAGTA